MRSSAAAPSGELTIDRADDHVRQLRLVPDHPARPVTWGDFARHCLPRPGLPWAVILWRCRNLPHLIRGGWRIALGRMFGVPTFYGQLWLTVHKADGRTWDLGLVSLRVVTTAGVNKIVAGLDAVDTATFSIFKFHGIGTGTNAEASADVGLQTELTTQYATDNVRPTGSQGVGSANNVYRTSATITPDSGHPIAVTEHGVLSSATVGSGTLLDRSVFSAVNLTVVGDAVSAQYDHTQAAGS